LPTIKKATKIDIGESPHLFYFSGKYEILSVDTEVGKISVQHGISKWAQIYV
jgi:hypothetical protein